MRFGDFFKDKLNEQGRSIRWLAMQLDMDEKTLAGKLNRNSIPGNELLTIARVLNINLDEIKQFIHIKSFIIPESKLMEVIQTKDWLMLNAIIDMADQYSKYCTDIIIEKDLLDVINPVRILLKTKDEYESWKKRVRRVIEKFENSEQIE